MAEFKWEEIDFKTRHSGKHPTDIAYDNLKKAKKCNAHSKIIEKLEEKYRYEIRLTAFILQEGGAVKHLKLTELYIDSI